MQPTKINRNLLLLGILSVGIAFATTVVSLVLYHNSGDIYLDRSRPGFLPDEEEVQNLPERNFAFPSSDPITEQDLDEYINHFEEYVNYIDDLKNPFSETPLSNQSLGIPPEPPKSEE